jgi:hypothetical protein
MTSCVRFFVGCLLQGKRGVPWIAAALVLERQAGQDGAELSCMNPQPKGGGRNRVYAELCACATNSGFQQCNKMHVVTHTQQLSRKTGLPRRAGHSACIPGDLAD